jgi:Protein of unknown function DUF111
MEITTAGLDGTALAAAPVPAGAQRERAKVRDDYETIAVEYDDRIPGQGIADETFTDAEAAFLLGKVYAHRGRRAGGDIHTWGVTAAGPGVLLTVLAADDCVNGVCAAIFVHASTVGVHPFPVERRALPRDSVTVDYRGLPVSVERGCLDGAVITAQPEYGEAKAAAEVTGQPLRRVLDEVRAAAATGNDGP